MKTHPQPGEIKLSPIDKDTAPTIARDHYDVESINCLDDGTYAVKTRGGFAAIVGRLDGAPAILHKLPDGTREIETLENIDSQPLDMSALFGEAIYSYTREQAIADGVLIDISSVAREAGFVFPVAITSAAWADCVAWGESDSERQTHQDESGRLWDVLTMLLHAIRSNRGATDAVEVMLYRVPRGGRRNTPVRALLKSVCGPGDDLEPVITIMLPGED